jgi:exosortase/archaeosortase family protein
VSLGFTLAVPGKWFFVDDACSGINSLFGMLSLAMVIAVARRMSLAVTLTLIPTTLAAVLFVNVVRMDIIVLGYSWYGIDLSAETPHYWLGLALLPLTVMLIVGLASWTEWLLAPIGPYGDSPLTDLWDRVLHGNDVHAGDHDVEDSIPVPPVLVGVPQAEVPGAARSWWEWLPIIGMAGAALVGQFLIYRIHAGSVRNLQRMEQVEAGSLPKTFDTWEFVDFQVVRRRHQDPQGEQSRVWRYRDTQSPRALAVSVDYSFPGWHELCSCYRAIGWDLQERKILGGHGKPFVVRAAFKDGSGGNGYLWYAIVDATGKTLEPPQQHWGATLRNQTRIALDQFGTDMTTRQVQMFLPSGKSLPANELMPLEQRFSEMIPRLAPPLVSEAANPALGKDGR